MTRNVKEAAAGKGGQARSEDVTAAVVGMMLEQEPCRYLGKSIPGKGTVSTKVLGWKQAW